MNYEQQTDKEEVKTWLRVNLVNYLKDNSEDIGEIEHIIDYMNSDKAPKRLQKMSYIEARNNAEKWLKALKKKGNNITETLKDVEVTHELDDGFTLVKLISEAAYQREGFLMGHCVGSYHGKGSEIYSLRDKHNQPHCTIEKITDTDGTINQIKGKGNGSIHPKYIKIIVSILKDWGFDLRDSEMGNLGYISVSTDYLTLAERWYQIDYIEIGDKLWVYKQ